jgi:23S rRNA pseudouridine2605 synthase
MIRAGRVQVNGQPASLGMKIDPRRDRVTVDGRPLSLVREKRRYIILHKPAGYVTTMHDPQGRPTVVKLLDGVKERVYPVGRLDYDSEGLLLLTNDGQLALRLAHPRYGVEKTYLVLVKGQVTGQHLKRLEKGIVLEDGPTAPARASLVRSSRRTSLVKLQIREGRNRQIRRMCQALGLEVLQLKRTGLGPLTLGDLAPGLWRDLSSGELKALRKAVDASSLQ